MIKNRLTKVLLSSMVCMSLFAGCSQKTKETEPKNIDFAQSVEDIMLNYSDKGMDILKANYPESEEMKIALKNIGRTPKNSEYKTLNGDTLTLENGVFKELKDKKVVIEVSQAHCPYCKETTPVIDKVLKDENYNNVELVTVFVNSTEDKVNDYYEELGLEKPKYVIINEDKSIVEEFLLIMTPTTIYLDGSGKVSYVENGPMDETVFKDVLKTAFEDEPIYTMLK